MVDREGGGAGGIMETWETLKHSIYYRYSIYCTLNGETEGFKNVRFGHFQIAKKHFWVFYFVLNELGFIFFIIFVRLKKD